MNNALYVQWKRPTDASRFVIDGEVSEYTGTETEDRFVGAITEIPTLKEIPHNKENNRLSPSFRCWFKRSPKSNVLVFLEGNFEETDFVGRNLVYCFMTRETNPQQIIQILQEYAAKLEVTLHKEDLDELSKLRIEEEIQKKNGASMLDFNIIKLNRKICIISILTTLLLFCAWILLSA